ncbi:MAG TPA: hypothetical protein VIV63_03175 [Steroidobacteraceae bacterium]
MKGRRSAALLCVLLVHAFVVYSLLNMRRPAARLHADDVFLTEPITLLLEPEFELEVEPLSAEIPAPSLVRPQAAPPTPARGETAPPAGVSAGVLPPTRIDWPIEGKKSAARVLAAEAEAERIARMFAGPDGTWASLTKRQRSKISKFRFKPGVDGLERDAAGNTIYHLSDGCVLVNFLFFGCAIGKPKVHDDMLENMRLYFDEQRLPRTDEGNGTEPGAQPLP